MTRTARMTMLVAATLLLLRGTGVAADAKKEITIDNFSFKEQVVTVAPGTEVTWVNQDDAPHKVVSEDKKTFKSPVLDTDGRFSFTFTKPGTYKYFCSIHPSMTGTVVVK